MREHTSDSPAKLGAERDPDCPFCADEVRAHGVAAYGTVLAIPDARPVTEGHLLVITRRHTPDFFTMTDQEKGDLMHLLSVLREQALRSDPTITGFNIGTNCGESAGQRILHAHVHFIPRREGEKARCVKGVIRNKMRY